jgi:hypothetical protein
LKVLEAVDGLERCVKIRQRFKVQGSKFKVQKPDPLSSTLNLEL